MKKIMEKKLKINRLNNNINIYSKIPSLIKFYPAQNKIDQFLESIIISLIDYIKIMLFLRKVNL